MEGFYVSTVRKIFSGVLGRTYANIDDPVSENPSFLIAFRVLDGINRIYSKDRISIRFSSSLRNSNG